MAMGHDVHWCEGQFILPHHFQQAALHHQQRQAELLRTLAPFSYGLLDFKYAESDCENYLLNVEALSCRLPDGTLLQAPDNCTVENRPFKQALEQAGGEMAVFLALPAMTELEPNTLPLKRDEAVSGVKYRHAVRTVQVTDYNTGANEKPLQSRVYNACLLFEGEPQYGYDCLQLGVIMRGANYGATPQFKPDYAPPCLEVRAVPLLRRILTDIGNRLLAKNRQLRAYWRGQGMSQMMKNRDAIKVQAVTLATNRFRQMAGLRPLHPHQLYLSLVDLISLLSIYSDDDKLVMPPEYDHDNLAACFRAVEQAVIQLLAALEDRTYEERPFKPVDDWLVCPLESDWLSPNLELYISFDCDADENAVRSQVAALKVAPDNQMAQLNERRLRGMVMDGPLNFVEGLPKSPTQHYFRISQQHPLFARLRSSDNPVLAISGPFQFSRLTTLYVLKSNS